MEHRDIHALLAQVRDRTSQKRPHYMLAYANPTPVLFPDPSVPAPRTSQVKDQQS